MPLSSLQSAAIGLALIKLTATPEILAKGETTITFNRPAGVVSVRVQVIAGSDNEVSQEGF